MQATAPNFKPLRSALLNEEWDDVPKHLTVLKSLREWLSGTRFHQEDDRLYFDKVEVPDSLVRRIKAMAGNGEDPTILFNFYERLAENPSFRSVNQLFGFLQHQGIPLTPDGHFLAYKSVDSNYKDHHSGLFDNRPGTRNFMPRNQISDDPKVACDEGFHVGALSYAQTFGGSNTRIVICKVDPKDVVCVPYDESERKVRVCDYTVVGNEGAPLPSTVFTDVTPVEARRSRFEGNDDGCDNDDDDEGDGDDFGDYDASEHDDEPVTKKTERPNKEKPHQVSVQKRKSNKGFAKFDKMDATQLLEAPIADLREYAFKGLEIVGASKIAGGKSALVARILEVRAP